MAADLLARGLAAQVRETAMPALARFADLVHRVIPPAFDRIQAGTGAAWGHYVADALATAQLAASHPRCCAADASGRYFRLEGVNGTIDFAHTGLTDAGGNMQPAVQAAIAYAAAMGIARVANGGGRADIELWCPVRTSPTLDYATDGVPLVVEGARRLTLDFGSATITLKGPTGNADRAVGQPSTEWLGGEGVQPWLGGWLYIVGSDSCEYVAVENVRVEGGFIPANVQDSSNRNLTDKGIRLSDTHVARVVLKNVELYDFASEICYLAPIQAPDGAFTEYYIENCVFDGSPQCAFNPNHGRLKAVNVQAGNSYQAVETLGGEGQEWIGCRFYDASAASFEGGPAPAVLSGHAYTYPVRRTDAAPPFINFHNLRLENCGQAILAGWAVGSLTAVDTVVQISGPGPCDINLDITSWCDRVGGLYAVNLASSAPTLTTQIPGSDPGVYYLPPANIDLRLVCKRTQLAKANGLSYSVGVRIDAGGLFDHSTIRCRIAGAANEAWNVEGVAVAGFALPLMEVNPGFQRLGYVNGYDFFTGDRSYKVAWGDFALFQTADGTSNITLDTTWGYVVGQRVRFHNASGSTARITSFAKNGAGLVLNADRAQRRVDEFLELEWTGAKWREVGYLDQGA